MTFTGLKVKILGLKNHDLMVLGEKSVGLQFHDLLWVVQKNRLISADE